MSDYDLNELLAYHQRLDDPAYSQQILTKIRTAEKQRYLIMLLFTVLGISVSLFYLWSKLPVGLESDLFTPTNGLLLSCIGLFMVWLWTDMFADGWTSECLSGFKELAQNHWRRLNRK